MMSFEEAFHRKNILHQLNCEIDKVFEEFDRDKNGILDSTTELDSMVTALMERGFVFGKLIMKGVGANGKPKAKAQDDEDSDYAKTTAKRVRSSLLGKIQQMQKDDVRDASGPEAQDEGVTPTEFRSWFHSVVVERRTNLRVLLRASMWLEDILEISFVRADVDGDGTVDLDELSDFFIDVAHVIGEPAPDKAELEKLMNKADRDCRDGQLTFNEFRYVVIEALTRIYWTHFNTSMNPFVKHTSAFSKKG